mmetsp:Transcript_2672/g.2319  ORF Transcript_2672/g.2319 Transcript_2672/m.2319 type:complete len:81 (+) Transcript_2672:65-307(+)
MPERPQAVEVSKPKRGRKHKEGLKDLLKTEKGEGRRKKGGDSDSDSLSETSWFEDEITGELKKRDKNSTMNFDNLDLDAP